MARATTGTPGSVTVHNSVISELKNIAQLIECDGQITLGHVVPVRTCVATATDEAQCLAMLVRRDGETLDDLLQRLDAAIADAYENDRFADEINRPQPSPTQPRKRRR
jgi:predicted RNase H-like HicB family nuclease